MALYIATHLEILSCEIYHSGKARARQTAEIVADQLFRSVKIMMETDGLAPLDNPLIWADRIKKLNEDVILVGHLPHLSKLESLLVAGNPDKQFARFHYACLVGLALDTDNVWELIMMLTPEII